VVDFVPGCPVAEVRLSTVALDVGATLPLRAELRLSNRSVASLLLVQAPKRCHGGLQERWRLPVLVQMHQNGLGRALVVPVLMSMMSIHARKRVMCATVALMLVEAEVGVGLEPCAFWGSWCTLGQTRKTSHAGVVDEQARF
jgi:hypothetical protein